MPRPPRSKPGRSAGALASTLGVLVAAALLPAAPASAAVPDGWPSGDWATTCADADSTYCVEQATVTPVGGEPTPLADLGLTVTVSPVADEYTTWLGWSIDGWAGQPAAVAGGDVTLVIRTGAFVPRFTTAVAGDLQVSRSDDAGADLGDSDDGERSPDDYTMTVTGRAIHVDWTTGEFAGECTARQYCGEFDLTADEAGTGLRFQGRTQDLDGNSQDFVDAIDGAYFATDAQAHTEMISYVLDDPDPYLTLGVLGNPQLDIDGHPVRNSVQAWLPDSYFAAMGTTVTDAVDTGFDLVSTVEGREASVPVTATTVDGGVGFDVPDIGPGAPIGEIKIFNRPSGAADGATAPDAPEQVVVTAAQGSAVVTWAASGSDGGSPVVGYRARAFSASTGGTVVSRCDADADATSCEVWGLTDGETYHFAVSAHSALGEGRAGARVAAVIGEPELLPPSAPRAVKLVAGPNRLAVTWTAPEFDGGAPVDSYWVRAYRVAVDGAPVAECEVFAPKRSCTLTALPGGRLYVGVLAFNAAGESPESDRPSATAWTAAGSPRSITAKSSGSRVRVGWAAPLSNGGTPVTGYRADVYAAAKGGSPVTRCTATAAGRSCTTPALKVGRTYYVSVTALNAAGASAQPTRIKVQIRK